MVSGEQLQVWSHSNKMLRYFPAWRRSAETGFWPRTSPPFLLSPPPRLLHTPASINRYRVTQLTTCSRILWTEEASRTKILILNSSKHVQFDTPQSVGLILQPPLLLSIKLALPRPRNNHFPSSNTENRTSFQEFETLNKNSSVMYVTVTFILCLFKYV